MRLDDLERIPPPKPVAKKPCMACKAFAAECLVPIGDGAVPMCWLCAHHVIDHEVPLHLAHSAECECAPQAVYPHRADEEPHGDLTYEQIQRGLQEHGERGHMYNPQTGCIEPFHIPPTKKRS